MDNTNVLHIHSDASFNFKRDTLANWQTLNPILGAGEPGVVVGLYAVGDKLENKAHKIKFGDGIHAWNDLPWWEGPDMHEALEKSAEAIDASTKALALSAEANSKYMDCVEATEKANKVREEIETGGYIESLKETNKGGKFAIWVGTSAEYHKLPTKTTGCLYIITDEKTIPDVLVLVEALQQTVAQQGKNIENNTNAIDRNQHAINEVYEYLTVLNEAFKDWVVETGVIDGWVYKKWVTGEVTCSKTIHRTIAFNLPYPDHLYHTVESIRLPDGLFTQTPQVWLQPYSEGGLFVTNIRDVSNKLVHFYIGEFTEYPTSRAMQIMVEVKGFWKIKEE